MIHTFDITLNINGYDLPAAITGSYTDPCKGAREYGTGLALEPDTDAEAELLGVEVKTRGEWVELDVPNELFVELQEELMEQFKKLIQEGGE